MNDPNGDDHDQDKGWSLLDAAAQHEAEPDSFPIPSLAERSELRPGDKVKLVFVLDPAPSSGPNAERMWVEVSRARADGSYEGWLTNEPAVITSLRPSAVIGFEQQHVAGIALSEEEVSFDVNLHAVRERSRPAVERPAGMGRSRGAGDRRRQRLERDRWR